MDREARRHLLRSKHMMMMGNLLRRQRTSEGRKQPPLTRLPDLIRLHTPPGVGNLPGLQKPALRKHLQQKVGKDAKVSPSKTLDNKRTISNKRPKPLKFDTLPLSLTLTQRVQPYQVDRLRGLSW